MASLPHTSVDVLCTSACLYLSSFCNIHRLHNHLQILYSFSFNLPHRTANKAFTLPLRTVRCSDFVFQLWGSVNALTVSGKHDDTLRVQPTCRLFKPFSFQGHSLHCQILPTAAQLLPICRNLFLKV